MPLFAKIVVQKLSKRKCEARKTQSTIRNGKISLLNDILVVIHFPLRDKLTDHALAHECFVFGALFVRVVIEVW